MDQTVEPRSGRALTGARPPLPRGAGETHTGETHTGETHTGESHTGETHQIGRAAIRDAAAGRGLRLVAQPILAVESAVITGYELLSRFDAGTASPDRWFAAARDLGLAGELTCAVFAAMHQVRDSLPANTFCTVNVEPDLLLDPAVERALHGAGDLKRVVVELTEHVSVDAQLAGLHPVMARIRRAGGMIAVDDAGTGYAGLTQLLDLRPDLIKLDRQLITGIDTDPVRRALVELVGALAGRMDAWLLAEGVESANEFAVLATLGVPLAQGWFIGRPAPPWPDLAPAAEKEIRALVSRSTLGQHVAPLIRDRRTHAVTDCDRAGGGRAGGGRAGGGRAEGDVLVDELQRPVHVVVALVGGGTGLVPAMTVSPASDPVDVLRRAMARPPEQRAAPVVGTDRRGHFLGVIEVPDLVEAALARSAGGDA